MTNKDINVMAEIAKVEFSKRVAKIDSRLRALDTKCDNIAQAILAYIKESSEMLGHMNGQLEKLCTHDEHPMDSVMKRIENINTQLIEGVNARNDKLDEIFGCFIEMKNRLRDVELNLLAKFKYLTTAGGDPPQPPHPKPPGGVRGGISPPKSLKGEK